MDYRAASETPVLNTHAKLCEAALTTDAQKATRFAHTDDKVKTTLLRHSSSVQPGMVVASSEGTAVEALREILPECRLEGAQE